MANLRQWTSGISNSGTSLGLTLQSPTLAGSALLIYTGYFSGTGFTSAVLTHDTLAHQGASSSGSIREELQAKAGITGGDTTCTLTFAGSSIVGAYLFEIGLGNALDQENDITLGAANPQSNSITTLLAKSFVLSGACWQAASTIWSGQNAGWTPFPDLVTTSGTNDVRVVASYQIAAATGTFGNTWTAGATGSVGGVIDIGLSALLLDQPYVPLWPFLVPR